MGNVRKEELYCPYEGGDLYGELYLPDPMPAEKVKFIILSHGIFSSYQAIGVTAQVLAAHGFGCYCFDFKGCSYSCKSGGDLNSCSIVTEKNELNAVLAYFKQQSFVDAEHIYLLGQSLGGVVSSLTAAEHPSDIQAMILMYPAYNFLDYVAAMFKSIEEIPEVVENHMGVPGMNLGRKFFADALECPFFETIGRYTRPVYILHGTADELVPTVYAEKAKESFADARLEFVEGAVHGFDLDENNIKGVLEFLD